VKSPDDCAHSQLNWRQLVRLMAASRSVGSCLRVGRIVAQLTVRATSEINLANPCSSIRIAAARIKCDLNSPNENFQNVRGSVEIPNLRDRLVAHHAAMVTLKFGRARQTPVLRWGLPPLAVQFCWQAAQLQTSNSFGRSGRRL
jgi:hypothetical protein